MIATREVIDRLCDAGMHPADAAVLLAKALAEMATKSPGARRQAAYRERHKASQSDVPLRPTAPSQSVTNRNEVTLCDAPLSKKERKKEEREPRARARASQLPEGWHPGEEGLTPVILSRSEWQMIDRLCHNLMPTEPETWHGRVIERIRPHVNARKGET